MREPPRDYVLPDEFIIRKLAENRRARERARWIILLVTIAFLALALTATALAFRLI
ncbi:MAG: hypothetical protein QHC90_25750 [Shinella sp.]|nr:hypothetical protein [Shinella sp.]